MGVTDRMVEEEVLCADWRRELMTDTAVYINGPATVRKMKLGGGLRTWMDCANIDSNLKSESCFESNYFIL